MDYCSVIPWEEGPMIKKCIYILSNLTDLEALFTGGTVIFAIMVHPIFLVGPIIVLYINWHTTNDY